MQTGIDQKSSPAAVVQRSEAKRSGAATPGFWRYREKLGRYRHRLPALGALSPTDLDLLAQVATLASNRQIAQATNTTAHGVSARKFQLWRKLGLRSHRDLLALATKAVLACEAWDAEATSPALPPAVGSISGAISVQEYGGE